MKNLNGFLNARLTIGAEGVQETTTNADSGSTKRQSLENIASTAYTTINEDRKVRIGPWAASLKSSNNGWEVLETRKTGVELPTTVVTEDDTLDTRIISEESVLGGCDALEDNMH
jgi:hypothetical protein